LQNRTQKDGGWEKKPHRVREGNAEGRSKRTTKTKTRRREGEEKEKRR